ncbi:alpha/beta fold hydrolase [Chelativorans sp. J32]|uniref:alpha/beta fold hydrolase n=1 Tax=Chelativorans sp. J32 TaxID=935840 RepID=UPI000483E460|nr:alpha/beta hydrolase [Chelativorans sp. J32]
MAFETATTLKTASGSRLRLYISRAKANPVGIVQINHGLAEHAGRYARFAAFLSERGFHVYAHDHRGHGHSNAAGTPPGHFGAEASAETMLADVLAVHERIAVDHPGLPLILFGHSMGAMIGLAFLSWHAGRVHGAALWNMPLGTRIEARAAKALLAWERFRLGSDIPSRILPRLTFQAWARAIPEARTSFDWLSRDAEEVDRYIADTFCGWNASVGLWRAVFDFNLMGIDERTLVSIPRSLPIQLVGGGADPSTNGGATLLRLERRLRRNGFSNLETRIYPENRHESLNELNRSLIMSDFVHWAKRALR